MFIHFLYLCPLRLAIMLNFNISKVAYSNNFGIGAYQHCSIAEPIQKADG